MKYKIKFGLPDYKEMNLNAERVYWLCIKEINRREEENLYIDD